MASDALREFEAAFADYQGAVGARAFWMGRIGLYAVLRALGVGEGDHVGICAYTCLGVVEAVTRLGARPIFLDVDRHMNISQAALERLETPIKVLVLQHTFGVPCDLDASLASARRSNVAVVEDACHALGSTWNGRLVGTFGLAAVYSFQWAKPFSTGQGGMLTVQDAGLLREVDRLIATEAVRPGAREAGALAVQRQLFKWLVRPQTRLALRSMYMRACARGIISGSEPKSSDLFGLPPGFLKLCSPSQARVGLCQVRRWPETMRRRQESAAVIRAKLAAAGVPAETVDDGAAPVYLRWPIWIRAKEQALAAAAREHVDIGGWYTTPGHPLSGPPLTALGYEPTSCPGAEDAFKHVVTLPTLPESAPERLDVAVRIIRGAV